MRSGGRRKSGSGNIHRWTVAGVAIGALAVAACRDVSGFTTHGDRFEGPVVEGDFVRSGVDAGTTLCLTIDTDHLQDSPGVLSTSDGRFRAVPLRSIPQLWHDPLSTLAFGEGRVKNLLYVAAATTPFADDNGVDAFVVVSLMQSGNVEVRLLRGAPTGAPDGGSAPDAGASAAAPAQNLFAVFTLSRAVGPCSY